MADERDRASKRTDEPDVELHAHSKAVDEAKIEAEDKGDDTPDVELHRHTVGH